MGLLKTFLLPVFKDVLDICSPILATILNEEIVLNKSFPENFNLANVTYFYKER